MAEAPTIHKVMTAEQVGPVRLLFEEYAAALGIDLAFQSFEQELADLPGKYAPPGGCLLLATVADEPAGCVALRPLSDDICEMKRLFVRDAHRGSGMGRRLVQQIIREAQDLGYKAMRLDTIAPAMPGAVALYRSLGFSEIAPYCVNTIPGAIFLELRW